MSTLPATTHNKFRACFGLVWLFVLTIGPGPLAGAKPNTNTPTVPNQPSAEVRAEFERRFREEWGRLPEPGELFDARRPLAVSLSPDGDFLAVDILAPSCEFVEVWDIRGALRYACPKQHFGVDAHLDIKWHPSRKLIAVTTEANGFWLLNADTGKSSYIIGAYPGNMTWAGNTDRLLIDLKEAGEQPSRWSIVNIWNAKSVPCPKSCFDTKEEGILNDLASSKSGNIAAELRVTEGPYKGSTEVVILRKRVQSWHWKQVGVIHPKLDSSGKVVAYPKLVNWLLDERLVYAMVSPQNDLDTMTTVELWLCGKDGSDQRKWFTLPNAQPAPDGMSFQWVSVSGNGKRVAFLRKNKVFVFDTKELTAVRQP